MTIPGTELAAPATTQADGEIVDAVRRRAQGLYHERELLCSEAVLVAVNEIFSCGLTREQAVGMSAALPVGLGGQGCLCGALSGAAVALGLLLSSPGPSLARPLSRKAVREASAALHERFTKSHGAACCRVLTKAVKKDKRAHFEQCEGLTSWAAAEVARLALELRPSLEQVADPAAGRKAKKPFGFIKRLGLGPGLRLGPRPG
ncbi:C_GCAxxG_C_C family protein [Desulfovibrio sp. X2]|uniref:C-GCAxxG-C-C family protein n=1 Tax=Desulfovibrio sp. X2 TaxID=941449 RepID=UPI0003589679|nr:C-GCAxxG-C-C family protein [Desulfovibrio sp. X2]EPR43696.1 C_GCAxxG_C_C family protein [Desulfovibrio sp. X2]